MTNTKKKIDLVLNDSLNDYSKRFNFPILLVVLRLFKIRDPYAMITKFLFEGYDARKYRNSKNLNYFYSIRAGIAVALQARPESRLISNLLSIRWFIGRSNKFLFSHPVIQRAATKAGDLKRVEKWRKSILNQLLPKWDLVQLPTRQMNTLSNVTVLSSGVTLDVSNSRVFIKNNSDDPRLPFVAGQWMQLFSHFDEETAWLEKSVLDLPTVSIESEVVDIRSRCSNNYWHSLIDGGTKLLYAQINTPKAESYIASSDVPFTVQSAYGLLAPKSTIIYLEPSKKYFVKNMITIPNSAVVFDNCSMPPEENCQIDFSLLRELSKRLCSTIEPIMGNKKKIMLIRVGNWRNVKGQEALAKRLIPLGFEVVDPSRLSFIQQIEIFSNAEIIIGASGAAWANLIFCKPGTYILSLCSSLMAPWDMHKRVGLEFDLVYRQLLMPSNFDRTSYNAVNYRNAIHSNFTLDVELVMNEVFKIIPHKSAKN
jgi:Glycosyltransferase 61